MESGVDFISKKGTNILIYDLEDYVNECKTANNEVKVSDTHFIVKCPRCVEELEYHKLKLYILKDYSVGYCFRCNTAYLPLHKEDAVLKFGLELPENNIRIQDYKLIKLNFKGTWNLSLFDQLSTSDFITENYLYKRNKYLRKLLPLLRFRYLNNNVVIPFYYKGELIYYQIHFPENKDMKYFSPPITHKPPYIIEHGENKRFIIVEGVFDAIAALILYPDRTPFAVLGSVITDYQIALLRSYVPEDILIFMDETELSIKTIKKLRAYIDYAKLDIIPSYGEDPEEYLRSLD